MIDCEPRALREAPFTFIFHGPRRGDQGRRRWMKKGFPPLAPPRFLIPESDAAAREEEEEALGRLDSLPLNFSRTFLIYSWHQLRTINLALCSAVLGWAGWSSWPRSLATLFFQFFLMFLCRSFGRSLLALLSLVSFVCSPWMVMLGWAAAPPPPRSLTL